MRIRWLKRALKNLEDEAGYIARDNPQAAEQVVTRIDTAVRMLAIHPGLGREGRVPGTRELVVAHTPYLVPYRVHGQQIEILRVFHASRRWPAQL